MEFNPTNKEKELHSKMIDIIRRQDNPAKQKNLLGEAILLLLKRQKINKLQPKQKYAEQLYSHWVAMQANKGADHGEFTPSILMEPKPTKEFIFKNNANIYR